MVRLYVAYFPEVAPAQDWLVSFRARHDPSATLVAPHVTLVFPTEAISEETLVAEARAVAAETAAFRAHFRIAMMMPEVAGARMTSHIFLVPDSGLSEIVRLHDRLYAGRLRPQLRLDLPFIPHLTVAAGLDLGVAKTLVDEINTPGPDLRCEVDHLAVMSIDDARDGRRLVARLALARHETGQAAIPSASSAARTAGRDDSASK